MFRGDSPWELFTTLTTSDMALYLRDRSARGFNSVLVEAIDNIWNANGTGANANGDMPFTTKQGGGSYTNSTTQSPDFSTPNEPYWKQVDAGMALCQAYGFHVLFYPIWIGNPISDPSGEGYYNALNAQSAGIRQAYGAFVGARYKPYKNLIWVVGGDNNPATTAVVSDVVAGIQSVDTSHLFSCDLLDGDSPLTNTMGWTPAETCVRDGVNNIYCDQLRSHPWTFAQCKTEYQRVDFPTVPYFQKEGAYEGDGDTGSVAQHWRSQTWQSLLGGGCGWHFGNSTIWKFGAGWQGQLGIRGTLDTQQANTFTARRRWDLLVPDWGNTFLTNGGSYTNANFASAARASDGTWAAIYVPTNESLTVDLSGFTTSSIIVQWFDPTTSALSTATGSPFSNSGTHTFSATPGTNAQGDADWVLLFNG